MGFLKVTDSRKKVYYFPVFSFGKSSSKSIFLNSRFICYVDKLYILVWSFELGWKEITSFPFNEMFLQLLP